jgi:hypothetical protein
MKFRSGVIPFATDSRVKLLRIAPDQTAYLKGMMFWGTLFASIMAGGIVAIGIFLFFWRVRVLLDGSIVSPCTLLELTLALSPPLTAR